MNRKTMEDKKEMDEGEKEIDHYDSDDDRELIESLESHIESMTPNKNNNNNSKKQEITAVEENDTLMTQLEKELNDIDIDNENTYSNDRRQEDLLKDEKQEKVESTSEDDDSSEDDFDVQDNHGNGNNIFKNLPTEEDFLNVSNIPNNQSFQALPLLYRSSEFIKNTDVDNLNLQNDEDEESYKSLLEYKRKYKKAISDLKFSKLEFEQHLINYEGKYTDEISKLKENMSALKKNHGKEKSEMLKQIDELNIRLARKVDIKKIEQLENELAVSKHQIETLQTQLLTADQMKEFLHSQWVEQQEIVQNVQKLIKSEPKT